MRKGESFLRSDRRLTQSQTQPCAALKIEPRKITAIVDVKAGLFDPEVLTLLAPSVYNPTPERLKCRAEAYTADKTISVYACNMEGVYTGIVVWRTESGMAEILHIAVKSEWRRHGIGGKLIEYILNSSPVDTIMAETDQDALGFYKKCGFAISPSREVGGTRRYSCKLSAVSKHYDLLIDENNDPVHDPEPLRTYMDQWDGQPFMDALHLDKEKSVLEIGVGTGRLAVRAAPNCREFCGIDLSPKTIARAKENLKGYGNVTLICGDFMGYAFEQKFDVIYSSLTFMHIKDKQAAIRKAKTLLHDGGRFVLSIDKSQRNTIDYGTRKIRIYPDNQEDTLRYIRDSGMDLATLFETALATVFCCTIRKERSR